MTLYTVVKVDEGVEIDQTRGFDTGNWCLIPFSPKLDECMSRIESLILEDVLETVFDSAQH